MDTVMAREKRPTWHGNFANGAEASSFYILVPCHIDRGAILCCIIIGSHVVDIGRSSKHTVR